MGRTFYIFTSSSFPSPPPPPSSCPKRGFRGSLFRTSSLLLPPRNPRQKVKRDWKEEFFFFFFLFFHLFLFLLLSRLLLFPSLEFLFLKGSLSDIEICKDHSTPMRIEDARSAQYPFSQEEKKRKKEISQLENSLLFIFPPCDSIPTVFISARGATTCATIAPPMIPGIIHLSFFFFFFFIFIFIFIFFFLFSLSSLGFASSTSQCPRFWRFSRAMAGTSLTCIKWWATTLSTRSTLWQTSLSCTNQASSPVRPCLSLSLPLLEEAHTHLVSLLL